MSRVLPILFNTDMVRAVLDSRKTTTRRLVKQSVWENFVCEGGKVINYFCPKTGELKSPVYRAPYQVGDILYVRETYCPDYFDFETQYGNKHGYKEDYDVAVLSSFIPEPRWVPSIHMPKEAARIWLRVTDVRVERLQEMWASDVSKEGLIFAKPYTAEGMLEKFSKLWDSTIKKADVDRYGWAANPWVWVIEFERCGKPESEG